jgi:hypothetical protein
MMRKLTIIIASMVAVLCTLAMAPGTATAGPGGDIGIAPGTFGGPGIPGTGSGDDGPGNGKNVPPSWSPPSQPDGYLYAWTEADRQGAQCRWADNADRWYLCKNNVGSVENRAYAGTYDAADLYWGEKYTGAYTCIEAGSAWLDLEAQRQFFDHGWPTYRGWHESVVNNIESSKWNASC